MTPKFRVYEGATGKMHEVCAFYAPIKDIGASVMLMTNNSTTLGVLHLNDQNILMQFIGMHDSNGTEIYEGDIVKCSTEDGDDGAYKIEYHADRDYPAFDLVPPVDCDSNGLSYYTAVGRIDVIGNIYQHPELLEAKK